MHNFYSLNESANRYSVEVNYRTTLDEVIDNWSKLLLGFVSAAMKQDGYTTKRVFEDQPYRIIVSSNNFDDGVWVGVVTHNQKEGCFHISKGFYKKDTKNVIVTQTDKCGGNSAAEVYKELKNFMYKIKDEKPHTAKLRSIKKKTGPIQGRTRPAQGLMNQGRPQEPEAKMGI